MGAAHGQKGWGRLSLTNNFPGGRWAPSALGCPHAFKADGSAWANLKKNNQKPFFWFCLASRGQTKKTGPKFWKKHRHLKRPCLWHWTAWTNSAVAPPPPKARQKQTKKTDKKWRNRGLTRPDLAETHSGVISRQLPGTWP